MAASCIGFGGAGLYFAQYGRGFPTIFIHEADVRRREAAAEKCSCANRRFQTGRAINLEGAAAFIARFKVIWIKVIFDPAELGRWNRADLENDPDPATEKLTATLLRFGGEHP